MHCIEAGGLRDEVLARAGLLVDQWTEAQTEWLERMGKELDRGRFELTNRYTQAFIHRQRAAGSSATNGPAQLDANKEAPPPPPLPAPPAEVLAPPALLRPTPIGALPGRPWSASQLRRNAAVRRVPSRDKELPTAQRMRDKLSTPEGRNLYKQRKAIVEPVFGQIKEARGLRRVLLRGLGACRKKVAAIDPRRERRASKGYGQGVPAVQH